MKVKLVCVVGVVVILAGICSCASGGIGAVGREYWPTRRWRTSRPERQGMDSATLEAISENIGPATDLPNIESVLVIRNGYIVWEEYFDGEKETLWPLYSATKSITSTLIGILITQGRMSGVEALVTEYLPSAMTRDISASARELTVEHLLTMSSGLDDDIPDIFRDENASAILSRPLTRIPGESFSYTQPNSNFLSVIITEVTGMKASEFAGRELFTPLGIEQYTWLDNEQYSRGSIGAAMTPRDLAKIGYLYLKGGTWEDTQLVSASYVTAASTGHVLVPPEYNAWMVTDLHYGYQWWAWPAEGREVFGGIGGSTGECMLCVVPEIELIVVITGAPMAISPQRLREVTSPWELTPLAIIYEHVLEAVKTD